jgi:tripartite-type tricarboxylate transporter receptor subunit TctC
MEVVVMKKIFNAIVITGTLILCMANSSLAAADYPTRPITLINPMAPGGSADVQMRAFASFAEKLLGQPFVVVNKTGAAGMIGLQACASAAPDGYTVCSGSNNFLLPIEWEIANGRKPLVTRNDFTFIGIFGQSHQVIAVPYNSQWKTLADLLNDAKANPGRYSFCSGGLYGPSHLTMEILMRNTGLKFRHVPYAGGGPSVAALVGNHVSFGAMSLVSVFPLVQGNKLRILALVSPRRHKLIPDIPTLRELGIDHEWLTWSGIWAPQKTPIAVVEKLKEVMKKATEDKSFIDTLEKPGDEVIFADGEEVAKWAESESEKYAKLFKQLVEEERSNR